MAHHPCSVRAQQVVAELGPVAAHDDEIGIDLFGGLHDLLVDLAGRDDALDVVVVCDVPGHELGQLLGHLLVELGLVVGGKELTEGLRRVLRSLAQTFRRPTTRARFLA